MCLNLKIVRTWINWKRGRCAPGKYSYKEFIHQFRLSKGPTLLGKTNKQTKTSPKDLHYWVKQTNKQKHHRLPNSNSNKDMWKIENLLIWIMTYLTMRMRLWYHNEKINKCRRKLTTKYSRPTKSEMLGTFKNWRRILVVSLLEVLHHDIETSFKILIPSCLIYTQQVSI